jgi:hypothetical protein
MKGQAIQKTLKDIEQKGLELQEEQAKLVNQYQELQTQQTYAKGQLQMYLDMLTLSYNLPEGAEVSMTDGTITYPD